MGCVGRTATATATAVVVKKNVSCEGAGCERRGPQLAAQRACVSVRAEDRFRRYIDREKRKQVERVGYCRKGKARRIFGQKGIFVLAGESR